MSGTAEPHGLSESSMNDRMTLLPLMMWLNGVAKILSTLVLSKKPERCFEQILFLQSSSGSFSLIE
jgi:hypothetical protein